MSELLVEVRAAAPDDRAAVLALAPRLAEGVAPWRDQANAREAGTGWLEDSLRVAGLGDGAVFVAVAGDSVAGASAAGEEIAGVISVRPVTHFTGERDGYIGELAVAASAARRGVGRALVAAARQWADEHGLANLTLHTGARNTGARAFYAAIGFREEEVRLTLSL